MRSWMVCRIKRVCDVLGLCEWVGHSGHHRSIVVYSLCAWILCVVDEYIIVCCVCIGIVLECYEGDELPIVCSGNVSEFNREILVSIE